MNKIELVQAWQAKIPSEQETRVGYKNLGIFRLQLTPDDHYAVTLSFQYRELIVWDFTSGRRLFSRSWSGYDKVRDLYLTPNGDYAVVVGETGGIVSIIPNQPIPLHPLPHDDYVIVNARSKRAISNNRMRVQVWDLEKNQQTITLETPTIKRDESNWWGPFDIHAISADGRLGAGMFDDHALVWDLETGKLLWKHEFGGLKPWQLGMIFTVDRQHIVLKNGQRVETWHWSSGRKDGPSFDTGGGRSHAMVFTPNGQTLITGTDNGKIQIWDWPNGYLKQTLAGHHYAIECLAVSADGEYLASTSDDTTLRKWHLASGKQVFSTLSATYKAKPLTIDPDGRYVISTYGHDGATLAMYDLASGSVQQILEGHQGDVNAVDFLSDGRLISASDDHTLRIWNLEDGRCIQTLSNLHTDRVQAVVAAPQHDRVVSAGADGHIIRWNLSTGRPVGLPLTYAVPTRWTEQYVSLDRFGHFALTNKAYSDDPERGVPILVDLESGSELFAWNYSLTGPGRMGGMLSPDGSWLIQPFGLGWNKLKIIHLSTKRMIQIQVGDDDQIRLGGAWCFTPEEQKLVCSFDTKVIVIDLQSGAFRFASVQASTRITALAVSSDGRLGAMAADESIRIWELSSGQELALLNTGHLFKLVFDPSNHYLVASGYINPFCCFGLRALTG
jgi:WD40 repeat protein